MIELNENAIAYMKRLGYADIVLDVILYTSWCAPPHTEVSVGFTDKENEYYIDRGYHCDESVMGKVYYPAEGVRTEKKIVIRYMEYPWISTFEVEGIRVISAEKEADELRAFWMMNSQIKLPGKGNAEKLQCHD